MSENDGNVCICKPETEVVKSTEIISMEKSEFDEKITPKKITDPKEFFMIQCECGGVHFRHAGYVEMAMPYILADKTKKVTKDSYQVQICVKCRKAYIWYDSQLYDISQLVDLEAWEKTEKELHRATGPGGEC